MIDRRGFLRKLLTGAVALPIAGEIDWERLLWVPKPIITVPGLDMAAVHAATLNALRPGLVDMIFKNDPLLAYLRRHALMPIPDVTEIAENFIFKPRPPITSLQRSVCSTWK